MKELKTAELEQAAQWIAENIPSLPNNVGELTAMLTEYAQSVQPQPEEESAVEMVIKEEKRLANSTPPREQPIDRNQLKAIIERHINYSGQGSDAIHMDDLVDELSAAHPIDERRIRFEVDKYEQRYRVDYSVNMLIGNKLFSIRALSEADAENKMAFLKSSLRELEVDKEYLERPSKDDLKREAKAFIDLVADPDNGSPMGLSEETLVEWLATFANGLLPTKRGVDKGAEKKHKILQGFCEKISKQQDITPEFAAIVQRYFWDLI